MKVLGICLLFFGAFSIYSSHQNQNLFKKPLPALFKWLGIGTLGISLVLLIMSLPKLVACLIWVMFLITIWSFAPLLSLFQRK